VYFTHELKIRLVGFLDLFLFEFLGVAQLSKRLGCDADGFQEAL